MGESATAQSAPSAAGALGGLLAVQVRRVAARLPCLAPVRGPGPAPPGDGRHEHACALLTVPPGQSQAGAAEWRDGLDQAAGEPGTSSGAASSPALVRRGPVGR